MTPPTPCFSTWHRRRWVPTQRRVDPGNIHADNRRLEFFIFFLFLTKTIWQTEFTLEMFLGARILPTTGLFFSLSDKTMASRDSWPTFLWVWVRLERWWKPVPFFFHRRPKNVSPVDYQTAGEEKVRQKKERASHLHCNPSGKAGGRDPATDVPLTSVSSTMGAV